MPKEVANENTADVVEPIVVGGGDSATHFDDLDQIFSRDAAESKQSSPKESKKEVKEEPVEEEVEEPKAAKESTDKELTDPKEAIKEALKAKGASKEEAEKVKLYKIKQGESELELRADTEVEVLVNGKPEKAPIQELINNYSGRTHVSREFSRLDQDRKKLDETRADLQSAVDNLYKLSVEDKNPEGAIMYLAELMGADPLEVRETMRKQYQNTYEQLKDLTSDQLEAKRLKDELTYRKQKEVERTAKEENARIRKEIEEKTFALMKQENLSEAEVHAAWMKANEDVKAGKLTLDKASDPEYVVKAASKAKKSQALMDVLTEVNPEWESTKLEAASNDLLSQWELHPSLTVEAIKDIAVELYGSRKAKVLSKKLKNSTAASTSQMAKPKSGEDAWSFDQL